MTSTILGVQAENDYTENTAGTVDQREAANDSYQQTNLFFIAMGTVWATAVVDAYITGVDAEVINVDAATDGSSAMLRLSTRF